MGINPKQFLECIIEPTLECMGRIIDKRMSTDEAKMLLLGTACAESQLTYLSQLNSNITKGFYQMEPATYDELVAYCKRKGRDFHDKVAYCIYQTPLEEMPHSTQLIYNLRLQTIFARLRYWWVPEPIPTAPQAHAAYWKAHYNTAAGKGTVAHYLDSLAPEYR